MKEKMSVNSYQEFLNAKSKMIESLTQDFYDALVDLGDDVKKLSWFASSSRR